MRKTLSRTVLFLLGKISAISKALQVSIHGYIASPLTHAWQSFALLRRRATGGQAFLAVLELDDEG